MKERKEQGGEGGREREEEGGTEKSDRARRRQGKKGETGRGRGTIVCDGKREMPQSKGGQSEFERGERE